LGWQAGDIVLTSPITFLATANCIVYAGATPDFVDINPITYTIDPNQVEDKIKFYQSQGKKVNAVIGIDFAGHPCDWKALRSIADKYGLQLVNDNCHAMGAIYYGDKEYAGKYADVVTQSYHAVKHITTGEGGVVLTKDITIDEKVRCLRTHGMTKDSNELEKIDGPWYYEMNEVGYNYRITDFQCGMGSNQLKKLDLFVQKRRKIAKKYDKSFYNVTKMIRPETHNTVSHAYHLYPLQINFDELALTKPKFFQRMKDVGVNLQVHYIPVHLQPFYKKNYGFQPGDFPVSESFYRNEVSLPIYPDLSTHDQKKVIKKIEEYINV